MHRQENLKLVDIRAEMDSFSAEYKYVFKDEKLLLEALTHPSYAAEEPAFHDTNQRLEFLGDSVLELILSEHIYHHLPGQPEGILTRVRAMLAKESTLASFAQRLHLDRLILLGRGEIITGGRQRSSILCDVFEAFLGAMYLDGGYDQAKALCLSMLPPADKLLETLGYEENPKGSLQEICQRQHWPNPVYHIQETIGPSHEPVFHVCCRVGNIASADGQGHSLRDAQKMAARLLLDNPLITSPAPADANAENVQQEPEPPAAETAIPDEATS